MCRCAIRRMVYLTRVIAKAARRLNRNKNIAVEHTGNNQHVAVTENFSRRFAPVTQKLLLCFFRKLLIKAFIVQLFQLTVSLFQQSLRDEASVIGSMRRNIIYKGLTVCRYIIQPVALLLHFLQQQAYAFNRIQTGSAADIGICRRIIMKNYRYFFITRLFVTQSCKLACLSCQHVNAVCKRHTVMRTIFTFLIGGNRHRMQGSVKFRHAHGIGNLIWCQPDHALLPPFIRHIGIYYLQHRHAQLLQIL